MIIGRTVKPGKATGHGRSGDFAIASIHVERAPLLDIVQIAAYSKRRADTQRAPLSIVLNTGAARRLYAALGSVLEHADANKQTDRVHAEIEATFGRAVAAQDSGADSSREPTGSTG